LRFLQVLSRIPPGFLGDPRGCPRQQQTKYRIDRPPPATPNLISLSFSSLRDCVGRPGAPAWHRERRRVGRGELLPLRAISPAGIGSAQTCSCSSCAAHRSSCPAANCHTRFYKQTFPHNAKFPKNLQNKNCPITSHIPPACTQIFYALRCSKQKYRIDRPPPATPNLISWLRARAGRPGAPAWRLERRRVGRGELLLLRAISPAGIGSAWTCSCSSCAARRSSCPAANCHTRFYKQTFPHNAKFPKNLQNKNCPITSHIPPSRTQIFYALRCSKQKYRIDRPPPATPILISLSFS
jgi:hypothetical protein